MTKGHLTSAMKPPVRANETRIELGYRSMSNEREERLLVEFGALMKSVATIGRFGGFSGDQFHPSESSVILREGGSDETAWAFIHSNVEAGLIFALDNLAQSLHFRDNGLEEIGISTPLVAAGHGIRFKTFRHYKPLPFEYLYDVVSPTIVVEAEFLKRQDARQMEAFRDAFDAWYVVAVAGGFADEEFHPSSEPAIFIQNDLQITSIGLQVVYEHAQVGEFGFNVLTNMLTHLHGAVAHLDSVEIA